MKAQIIETFDRARIMEVTFEGGNREYRVVDINNNPLIETPYRNEYQAKAYIVRNGLDEKIKYAMPDPEQFLKRFDRREFDVSAVIECIKLEQNQAAFELLTKGVRTMPEKIINRMGLVSSEIFRSDNTSLRRKFVEFINSCF